MQQQPPPPPTPHNTLVPMPQLPPTNITTEQIQKYLDENKQLILAILDNQNLGKLSECAQYQAQLQKNLLYLAAIADAQPQAPAVRAQMLPQAAAMQQGGHYMMPQPSIFPSKAAASVQFNPQQQMQEQHQFHAQAQLLPAQAVSHMMAIRPGFNNGTMHVTQHAEPCATAAAAASSSGLLAPSGESEFPSPGGSSLDICGSKQDAASKTATAADGHRSSANEHGGGDVEAPSMKRPPEGKTP